MRQQLRVIRRHAAGRNEAEVRIAIDGPRYAAKGDPVVESIDETMWILVGAERCEPRVVPGEITENHLPLAALRLGDSQGDVGDGVGLAAGDDNRVEATQRRAESPAFSEPAAHWGEGRH